jgi:DNA (cytosine-5)-methyltransferase 1
LYFISLFSGAGGLDLGFEQVGFRPIVAYDNSQSAVKTYNHNRPKTIAKCRDLSQITADTVIMDVRKQNGFQSIYGIVGGPPCQYFSIGNRSKRIDDDPRRMLPLAYAHILGKLTKEFDLDFFIFENVYGLAKPAHKEDFQVILSLLEKANFHVFHDILDAYNFGIPQNRKRVFIIGWNKTKYPDANFEFPRGTPSGLTIRDAIWGLEEPQYFEKNLDPRDFPEHPNHWTMQPRSKKFSEPPPPDLKNGTRSFKRLSWNSPSYTVAYGHNEIHVHPEGHRRLSIYEAMLLQGFPRNNYELIGNFSEQVTLVSDAVPPPLAAALAKSIVNFMENNQNYR